MFLSIYPICMLPATTRHRHASDVSINIVQPGVVQLVEDLSDVLVGHRPLAGERPGVGEAVAAVAVVRDLVVANQRPHLALQEVQVGCVLVAALPLLDELLHLRDGAFD